MIIYTLPQLIVNNEVLKLISKIIYFYFYTI